MATRNERKRKAKAKSNAITAQIAKMVAEQAARLAERDALFAKLSEYPVETSRHSVIRRSYDLAGKVQSRGGKRKFVAK